MNKQELVDAIAAESGLSKETSKKSLDAFVKVIAKGLKQEEKIAILGFGTFEVKSKAARVGVNPRTKEKVQIPAKKSASFKAGADLKDL